MAAIQPFLGLAAIILFAWAISENRRGFSWRLVAAALVVQFALALLLLKLPQSQIVFVWLNDGVVAPQNATEAGTSLVLGFLGGGSLPFKEQYPGAAFILAFWALPLVLLMSALSALLYHWRILPWIVRGFAWALGKALGISGAASFGTAANVFVGMVEAPLLIRPYLNRISLSELFIVMTAGMATIAGTMYALYVAFLADVIPGAAGHLLTTPLSLQRILGWVMAPVTWLIGIPWSEAAIAGQLLGIKVVLNELLAYLELAKLPPEALSDRSRLIMTYAMCGFAHFGSLGIMIGGMGAMATCMTGAVVAVLV